MKKLNLNFLDTATDDVPVYIQMYLSNTGSEYLNRLTNNFIITFFGNEPGWYFLWWPLMNIFNMGIEKFVFTHYFLIFILTIISFRIISKNYYIVLLVTYFLLTPMSLDSITHIWRQQLSFSIFLIGVAFYYIHNIKIGKYLIFISPLFHIMTLFFIFIFIIFKYEKKIKSKNKNLDVLIFSFLTSTVIVIILNFFISLLSNLGVDKILDYTDGGFIGERIFIILVFSVLLIIFLHFKFIHDNFNRFLFVILNCVLIMVLFSPNAYGLNQRMLMFISPIMGIYLVRTYLNNSTNKFHQPIFLILIILSISKIYLAKINDVGVIRYLAYGDSFQLYSGLIYLIKLMQNNEMILM